MDSDTFRNRIYRSYVHARPKALAPSKVFGFSHRAAYLRRLIRHHFPDNRSATILDLGCGHGALLYFAREAGYHNLHGVDRSPEQVEAAQMLGIEGVELADLLETLIATPSDSLDLVIAFDVIEHFTRDELIPFVDQVRRVLKPEGRWIIHVPNGMSPFFGAVRYGDITHELAFTCVSLNQLLLSSGFSQVRCYEDIPAIHGLMSMLRWILWKIFRFMLQLYFATETGNFGNSLIFSQNLLAIVTK